MMQKLEIRLLRAPLSWGPDTIEMYILDHETRSAVKELVFEAVNQGEHIPVATRFKEDIAQQMMDQLWQAGLRPSEGTGSAGSLAATQNHLADMKQIAFHALKIEVKK